MAEKKLIPLTAFDTGKAVNLSAYLNITKVIELSKTLDFGERTAIHCADGSIHLVKESAKTIGKLFKI